MLFNDPGTDFLDFGGNSRARSPGSPIQNASDFSPHPQFNGTNGNNARARSPGSPVQFQQFQSINSTNTTNGGSSSSSNPFLSRNDIMRPLPRELSASMGGVGFGSTGKPDSRPDTSGSRRSDSESNQGTYPSSPALLTLLT